MIEELWDEVLNRLAPHIACYSVDEAAPLLEHLWGLHFKDWRHIDWQRYPDHVHFEQTSEVIPLLESLLTRAFDDTVYVYSPDSYLDVIKVPLREFLEGNYIHLMPMWMWNPCEGYIVEVRSIYAKTVGLIPPAADPLTKTGLLRDSFGGNVISRYHDLRVLLAGFGAHMLWGREAENLLERLHDVVPFTPWLHIDWEKVSNKQLALSDISQVIPVLSQLVGSSLVELDTYIQWSDTALPLVKANLIHCLNHYHQLRAPATETILFNLDVGYIVEITVNGIINVGLIQRSNS